MERLETKNLVLRKATENDQEAIWKNIWQDEAIAKWMYWQPTKTYEEAVDRLERTIKYQSGNHACFVVIGETVRTRLQPVTAQDLLGFIGGTDAYPNIFPRIVFVSNIGGHFSGGEKEPFPFFQHIFSLPGKETPLPTNDEMEQKIFTDGRTEAVSFSAAFVP